MTDYRLEIKYIIGMGDALQAESFLRSVGMSVDPYAPDGQYSVVSLYFGNLLKSDYYERAGGFLERVKIRGRVYRASSLPAQAGLPPQDDVVWLEAKERHDAAIHKVRFPLPIALWEVFMRDGSIALWHRLSPAERTALHPILQEVLHERRRPEVLVRYVRRPYLMDWENESIRITFDSAIEASSEVDRFLDRSADGNRHWMPFQPFDPYRVVMEVKFKEKLPPWFKELAELLELQHMNMSKYCTALEKIRFFQTMPR